MARISHTQRLRLYLKDLVASDPDIRVHSGMLTKGTGFQTSSILCELEKQGLLTKCGTIMISRKESNVFTINKNASFEAPEKITSTETPEQVAQRSKRSVQHNNFHAVLFGWPNITPDRGSRWNYMDAAR